MGQEMQAAIDELVRVFPAVPLDPATAWRGGRSGYLWPERFEAGIRDRRWTDLTPDFLEWNHDVLWFLDPAWSAGYLAACLRAILQVDKALDALPGATFSRLSDGFDELIAVLSPAQQLAIANALETFVDAFADKPRSRTAREVLQSHWQAIRNQ